MYLKRIEELRVDGDLTQQEVADILNIQREVYRRYEKGTRDLPLWALIRLAQYYRCTTDYILGLSDSNGSAGDIEIQSEQRTNPIFPK